MPAPVLLETPRLLLREFALTDWRDVHAYSSDPKVVQYFDWGPNSEQETLEFLLHVLSTQKDEPRTDYHLAITVKPKETLVGACMLAITNPELGEGTIGYILRCDAWGCGYATEAARAVAAFSFERLNLQRLSATCDTLNAASIRILEKLGFEREKTILNHKYLKIGWRDSHLYMLARASWPAKN